MRQLLLTLICFCFTSLPAQTPNFVHYTSTRTVNDIVSDGQYVWAATNGGVVRYDLLTEQTTYYNRGNSGLPMNEVLSIAIGPDETIWMGTRFGLVRWKGNAFNVLNPLFPNGNEAQLTMDRVRVDGTGKVWVSIPGQGSNLLSFDGQHWKAYDNSQFFGNSADFETNLQTPGIWVNGGDSHSFFFFDGTTKEEYPFPMGVETWNVDALGKVWASSGDQLAVPNGNTWDVETLEFWPNAIAPAPDGSLWGLDGYDGVYKRNPSGVWEHVFNTYIPFDVSHAKMLADNQGYLWLGTEKVGLKRLRNGAFDQINHVEAEIPNNSIAHLEITGTQTVWAIFDDGFVIKNLARFEQNKWETFDEINPSAPLWKCKSMAKDGLDRLWVAHFDELYRFDGQWQELAIPAEFTYGQVYSVAAQPNTNTVWIGGYGKIARYNGSDIQVFDLPSPWLVVEKLTVDQQGNVWIPYAGISYDEMLCRFDGTSWTVFSNAALQLSEFANYIRAIKVAPNGDVWVVTPYEISSFDGTDWHKFPLEALSIGGEFNTMAFDGTEKFWIGCYQLNCLSVAPNLNLIKVEGNDIQLYPYLSTPLPYPNIMALAVDGHHNLWIGGEAGGIAVFNENGVTLGINDLPSTNSYSSLPATAFPNPSSNTSVVEYTLDTDSDVLLELRSITGQLLQSKRIINQPSGKHQWPLTLNSLAQGTYCWRVLGEKSVANGTIMIKGY